MAHCGIDIDMLYNSISGRETHIDNYLIARREWRNFRN